MFVFVYYSAHHINRHLSHLRPIRPPSSAPKLPRKRKGQALHHCQSFFCSAEKIEAIKLAFLWREIDLTVEKGVSELSGPNADYKLWELKATIRDGHDKSPFLFAKGMRPIYGKFRAEKASRI